MPINGLERSPCIDCRYRDADKLKGKCAMCVDPMTYSDQAYGRPDQVRAKYLASQRRLENMLRFSDRECGTDGCSNTVSAESRNGICQRCRDKIARGYDPLDGAPSTRHVDLELGVEILIMHRAGYRYGEMAEKFGLSKNVIRHFVNGLGAYKQLLAEADQRIFQTGRSGEHLGKVVIHV